MGLFSIEFWGRLHPLIIHFPIAALILAALIEAWRLRRDGPGVSAISHFLAAVGAAAALAATATGWLFAAEHHRSDTALLLNQHRWLGVATAVLAVGAWWAVHRWGDAASHRQKWVRRGVVWSAALALALAAHFGAMLVWGEDYFTS
jgi:uncharacterized membrane protein